MAKHMSDLKSRELQLRAILHDALDILHPCAPTVPAEQTVEDYKKWRVKACNVLQVTSRRGTF